MVQNCPNITNPSGSSHEEQLVPKRLTLVCIDKTSFSGTAAAEVISSGFPNTQYAYVRAEGKSAKKCRVLWSEEKAFWHKWLSYLDYVMLSNATVKCEYRKQKNWSRGFLQNMTIQKWQEDTTLKLSWGGVKLSKMFVCTVASEQPRGVLLFYAGFMRDQSNK